MWNSKSCPRCRGNIVIDEDVSGRFEKCLQCGYERDIVSSRSVKRNQSDKKTKMGIS
jgi:DNA-directed RNA polymerase subunit M/transcription elongation factor TFIIS